MIVLEDKICLASETFGVVEACAPYVLKYLNKKE
jgi:hypothetical protein